MCPNEIFLWNRIFTHFLAFQVYTTPAWCVANWWQSSHKPGQTQNIQTFLRLGKGNSCLFFYCRTITGYNCDSNKTKLPGTFACSFDVLYVVNVDQNGHAKERTLKIVVWKSWNQKLWGLALTFFVCMCFPDCVLYLLYPHYSLPIEGKSRIIYLH